MTAAKRDPWLCDITHPGEPCPADAAATVRFCGFCGAPIKGDAQWSRDPWDGKYKWVCDDAEACAERGRKT